MLLCLAFVQLAVARAPASQQGVVVQEIACTPGAALPVQATCPPSRREGARLVGEHAPIVAYQLDPPARLLVIDHVEPGTSNTVVREP